MTTSEIPKRIFFWTLFVLFWLVSATIIGYAFGYRYSFQRGVFIYGGSITLKTTPQEVNVYINGILSSSKSLNRLNNSYNIGGIRPGEYFLEVKAPGFQTWSKKVAIHSGISTEFWNVVLAETSYTKEDYDSAGAERLFLSPRKNLAAFAQQTGDQFIVNVFDPNDPQMKQIFFANDYVFTNDAKENIEWSPQAHRLIIPALKNGEKNYFIVTIDTQETVDLKGLTQAENLSHVRWDPKNKDVMFYMSDDNLYRMDLNAPDDRKIVAEHIASYDLTPKALFYFQLPEGMIYKTSFDATDTPEQITTAPPTKMDDNSYQIIVYDNDRIVFLNKSGNLYIYNKGEEDTYSNELSNSALGSQFSDDGKKLLYWTDHEIFTYFVRKWEVQPVRAENEIMPITRLSDPIENAQWTRDYEHVLFINNNEVKMIEIDNRDHRNMMDVLSLSGDNPILIDNFSDGRLYYSEINKQNQKVLRSINFPETSTPLQSITPPDQTSTMQQ